MRITSIRIEQKTNLGNYESLGFAAEAVVDEGEKLGNCTARLANYVDWYARKPLLESKARQCRIAAGNPTTPENEKAQAWAWLDKYEARKAEVESMQNEGGTHDSGTTENQNQQ